MDKATLHARVDGVVQGIGFRYAAVRQARRLGLKGYVRNLPDSRVEVVAEGELKDLQDLKRWLEHGPPGAIVRQVESRLAAYRGIYKEFNVAF